MDIRTCIESRVSTRLFNDTLISNEILHDIIDAARYAPSPKNRQPWRFAVLTGTEKATIVKICRNGLHKNPAKASCLMEKELASESYTFDIIDQAPVLILVFNAFPSRQTLNNYNLRFATVYKGNIIKNLIMDCQSYTKYRPNETTGGIFVSWRRKEELPTGA